MEAVKKFSAVELISIHNVMAWRNCPTAIASDETRRHQSELAAAVDAEIARRGLKTKPRGGSRHFVELA